MDPLKLLAERVAKLRRELSLTLQDAVGAATKAQKWLSEGDLPVGQVNDCAQLGHKAAVLVESVRELTDAEAILKWAVAQPKGDAP